MCNARIAFVETLLQIKNFGNIFLNIELQA